MLGIIDYWRKMFDYKGKSGRKNFWLGSIANALILYAVFYILSYILAFIGGFFDADVATVENFFVFLFVIEFIFYFLASLSAIVRRLRDAGISPWWIIGWFFPGVNIVVLVFLFFKSKETAMLHA